MYYCRLKKLENEIRHYEAWSRNEMTKQQKSIAQLTTLVQNLDKKYSTAVQDLQGKYNSVKTPRWPAGGYCIWKSGNCPAGFHPISAQLLALRQYANRSPYIVANQFGNSRIGCHGNCNHGDYHGDIQISVCCK